MSKKRKGTGRTSPRPWQPLVGPVSGQDPDGTDRGGVWFGNAMYSIQVRGVLPKDPTDGWPERMIHLSIHRKDRSPILDWRHLQRIKNEICGPECEAMQLFPAEDRVVDTANEFHVWVFPPGYRIPFGFFNGRLVMDDVSDTPGAKQRPLDPDTEAVTTLEQWRERLRVEAPESAKKLGI